MLWNSASLWLHPRSASLSLPVYRNTLFNAFCLYKTYSPEYWGWQPQTVYLASLWSSTLFGRSAAPTTFTLAHLSHLSARGDNTIHSSFIKRKKFPTLSFSGVNEQMGSSMNSFCLVTQHWCKLYNQMPLILEHIFLLTTLEMDKIIPHSEHTEAYINRIPWKKESLVVAIWAIQWVNYSLCAISVRRQC